MVLQLLLKVGKFYLFNGFLDFGVYCQGQGEGLISPRE